MQVALTSQDWFQWAIALILGFPFLMIFLNEVIVRLRQEEKSLIKTFFILRNLVLPTVALLLFLTKVLEISEEETIIRIVKTLVWICIIHAALSGFKVLVFDQATPESWQAKVPDLLLDLMRFFLVTCIAALILSTVWQVDLGALLTAFGVGSLVIGLALQDALKNLFSGILLLFERPFALGDWLKVGDTIGKVIKVNWRSVYLQTRAQDSVVIPNSILAQGNFTNYHRPTELHVETFTFGFSYDDPPNKVIYVLKETALATPGILNDPKPWVRIENYADFSIIYKIGLFIQDYEGMLTIRNDFVIRVWYAAKRYHLTIPYPIQTEYQMNLSEMPKPNPVAKVTEMMRSLPNFGSVAAERLTKEKDATNLRYYAQGEWIFQEGERIAGLHLILTGYAAILVRDNLGQEQEIAQLGKGEFFGEKILLTGECSDVSVIALDDLEVAVLSPEVIATLLEQMPRLSQEFSELLETRRKEVIRAKNQNYEEFPFNSQI
ncbi:mechanosensitive ion channel domain-containing protein [Crocosphaera sp. UHCC 0190]|uniref:mechanosensitive ion channel domain-containing protein n=1 Tax=Crocosphaera sp. UHCC 0190 TaxID=3110246 RepID=UPI002B20A2EB|nr:mechanosensitive ion channel domain-containing protein [Crocosphaera sp. UHCC 0190]MEA5508942.1 mechanosensitive ion channel domain-containing protein [Crocosphaera sp. UHCC 0190]